MASLVLGVAGGVAGAIIGGAIGAPVVGASIGWAIGSAAGTFAGSLLFPPKFERPQLADLKLSTSSYGRFIPYVWGTIRLAGNGVGQSDLRRHEGDDGGKGGGGGPTADSYSADFAFQIAARPPTRENAIVAVSRRWANNRLITDGEVGMEDWPCVVYLGDETQLPDPTLEALFGAGNVPAMRSTAYEVVTDKYLTDFGNALPNMEYEVRTKSPTITPGITIVRSNFETGSQHYNYPLIMQWASPDQGPIVGSIDNNSAYIDANAAGFMNLYHSQTLHLIKSAPDQPWPDYQGLAHRIGIAVQGGPCDGVWFWARKVDTFDAYPFLYAVSNAYVGAMCDPDASDSDLVFVDIFGSSQILAGLYPVACAMTQNGTYLYLFTSTVSTTSDFDQWFKYSLTNMSASLVDSGTVDPPLPLDFIGTQSYQFSATGSASFENNGRYMWYMDSNITPATVSLYYIDDSKNFALADSLEITGFLTGSGDNSNAGVFALGTDGYCGVARGPGLALLARSTEVPEPTTLDEVMADLCELAGYTPDQYDVTDLSEVVVRGFMVASQMEVGNAIDVLRKAYLFDGDEIDGRMVWRVRRHDADYTIPDDDLGAHVYGEDVPTPLETIRTPESELPRTVYVKYLNAGKDYQVGTQYARREVTLSQTDVTLDLPVVLTDGEAKHLAETHLYLAWLERERFVFYVGRKWMHLTPMDVVDVRGRNMRIGKITETPQGVFRCEAVLTNASPYTQVAPGGEAGGGGYTPPEPPDARTETSLILLDIPLVAESQSATAIRAAMYPSGIGLWPGATLYKSADGGTNYTSIVSVASASVVGTVADALGTFTGGNVIDNGNVIEVNLATDATLSSVTNEGLQNGLNLVALGSPSTGWELLQFKTATLTGTRAYTLSGLLRHRFGSESAKSTHQEFETLVLVSTTVEVPGAQAEIGLERQWKAVTSGMALADADEYEFTNRGVALKALAPVLLGYGVQSNDDVELFCVPRRRGSGGWPDGVDLPATDPANWQFEIATLADFSDAMAIGTTVPSATFTAAQQTSYLGGTGMSFYWRVAQFSALGLGYFAESEKP